MTDPKFAMIVVPPDDPVMAIRKRVIGKYRDGEIDMSRSMQYASKALTGNGFDKWDALLQYISGIVSVADESNDFVDEILSTIASIDIVADLNDYFDEAVKAGDTRLPVNKFCEKLEQEVKK